MYLQKNDLVALIAPAGFLANDLAVKNAQELLSSWGLESIVGKNVYKKHGHFSGTDAERLEDLQDALNHPDIKLIWALRGSYGSNRIIDAADFAKFKQRPKIVAGFSDITILHNKLQHLGFPSLHTLMPVNLKDHISGDVLQQTKNAFFGNKVSYSFARDIYSKNVKDIKGVVVGGNLSNLYSLLGTNLDIDTQNKILLIEDVGEQLYQIDRMLVSMKKAGKLIGLKALFVGQFTDIPENDSDFGKTFQEIILEHTQIYDYPVIFGLPVGHVVDNYPIIFGRQIELKVEEDLRISF